MQEMMLDIIRAATMAPSGHNVQPWKFSIMENEILMMPDFSRILPLVDPDNRELFISIGCALENLLIAAHISGFEPLVDFSPDGAPDCIRITLSGKSDKQNGLYKYIPLRQSTRSAYDGKPIPAEDLHRLTDIRMEDGVSLQLFTSRQDMEPLISISSEGCRKKYADKSFIKELVTWLRFNDKEALKTMDGLFTKCVGIPPVPRWLGKIRLNSYSPESVAEKDERKMKSSSALAIFSSERDDRLSWISTGRVIERFALTATGLDLKMAFVSQALQVPALRTRLQHSLGFENKYPQFFVRLGYAPDSPRSFRRPLEQVLT